MTGVRPSRRITSMVRPSILRRRAQSVIRVTARSMCPCSAHLVSYMGDLAGRRMESGRAGALSGSRACADLAEVTHRLNAFVDVVGGVATLDLTGAEPAPTSPPGPTRDLR